MTSLGPGSTIGLSSYAYSGYNSNCTGFYACPVTGLYGYNSLSSFITVIRVHPVWSLSVVTAEVQQSIDNIDLYQPCGMRLGSTKHARVYF